MDEKTAPSLDITRYYTAPHKLLIYIIYIDSFLGKILET